MCNATVLYSVEPFGNSGLDAEYVENSQAQLRTSLQSGIIHYPIHQ